MIVDVEMITKFCEACGVINREMPGRFEVPTALNALTCSIKESLNEYFQPILDPNDLWKGDVTMLYLPVLPDLWARRHALDLANELGEASNKENDSFLLNIMWASVGYDSFRDDVNAKISEFLGATRSQLFAFQEAKQMSLDRYYAGIRFVRMMIPAMLSSRGLPMTKRPNMFELVIGANEVISDLEDAHPEVRNNPEVQELKCLLKLVVGSPLSDSSVSTVLDSPDHREEGAYLAAWRQALFGLEIDIENANRFLRSDLAQRDPLTTVLVLHRLGRNDEAFEHLEQLVKENDAWREDLKMKARNELAGVRAAHYIRYDELAYGKDQ
jgi:hypothetical protein